MYLHDLVSGMEAVSTSDCGEEGSREGGREGGRERGGREEGGKSSTFTPHHTTHGGEHQDPGSKTVVPDSWAYSVRIGIESVESGVPHNREHLLPILTPPLIPERDKYSHQSVTAFIWCISCYERKVEKNEQLPVAGYPSEDPVFNFCQLLSFLISSISPFRGQSSDFQQLIF